MLRCLLLSSLLLLSSCSTTQPTVTPSVPLQHPEWPSPVLPYRFDWKVIIHEEKVYVGLEYDQSVEFRVFLEDIRRYIKESNGVICFYREDLKESRCYQQKVVDSKTK